MRVRIRGRWWTIRRRPIRGATGLCYDEDRKIFLRPTLKGRTLAATILHEGLHACFPDLAERPIEQTEEALLALLEAHGLLNI